MLSIKAYQDLSVDPNGWCHLRIDGLALPAKEPLELCFKRAGSSKPFLAARGWQENAAWLLFDDVSLRDGALLVRVGPEQTRFLSQVTTIEVAVRRLREQAGATHRARVVWPRILLEVEDHEAVAPRPRDEPAPLPPSADESTVLVPTPELRAVAAEDRPAPRTDPLGTKTRWPVFAGLGLLSVVIAVAAVLYFLALPPFETATPNPDQSTISADAGAGAKPGRPFTEEEVRRFLAGNPEAPAAVAEAEAYEEAGRSDLALLIYRHADRQGNTAAANAIGRMYDPATYSRETSPFPVPDADRAAEYYHRAAEGGDIEGQYLLGRLLMSGATSGETDVEKGVVWLERAANSGHAAAKELLSKVMVPSANGN
jgi:Sel1 repeat